MQAAESFPSASLMMTDLWQELQIHYASWVLLRGGADLALVHARGPI